MPKELNAMEFESAELKVAGYGGPVADATGAGLIVLEGECSWHPLATGDPAEMVSSSVSPSALTSHQLIPIDPLPDPVRLVFLVVGLVLAVVVVILTYLSITRPREGGAWGKAIVVAAFASVLFLGTGALLGAVVATFGAALNVRTAGLLAVQGKVPA